MRRAVVAAYIGLQRRASRSTASTGSGRTTGGSPLPPHLKAGVEALSGLSMDHVRVHRSSPRPALMQADALAQGREIHLGPGQERFLAHEAWHVVQQAQGRVPLAAPRSRIVDDPALEREADAMAARILAVPRTPPVADVAPPAPRVSSAAPVQLGRRKKLTPKQEESRQRLLAKRAVRQARYAEQAERERQERDQFWGAWQQDIDGKTNDVLYSSEVAKYIKGGNLDKKGWDEAVEILRGNMTSLYQPDDKETRQSLRQSLEAPWRHKTVNVGGQARSISTMPAKIWNVIQEALDARTLYRSRGVRLFPGVNQDGLEPDYVDRDRHGNVVGLGDAINLVPTQPDRFVDEALKAVTSKVAAYPDHPVTVVIGAHETPELLTDANLNALNGRIAGLERRPDRVYLISGSAAILVYPYVHR